MKRDRLVEIALTCQGKRVCSKKSDYKYKSESEIESMNEEELKELLNSMINREPGTFRYSESSWTRDKLMNFIGLCGLISLCVMVLNAGEMNTMSYFNLLLTRISFLL